MSESELAPWQRVYSSPGEAIDAMLKWRPEIPTSDRPGGFAVAHVPGEQGQYMLALTYPSRVVIEVFDDHLDECESYEVNTKAYLENCISEIFE